jgi:catechol 2,3-dioxygenase
MINGGHATVFVSNMENAIRFYTEILGLKLTNRFGDHWATVDAGPGLTIGIHPKSPLVPAPGTKGSMMLGIELDEPIEGVVARLSAKGVHFTGAIAREPFGAFIHLEDPDGNPMYFRDAGGACIPQQAEPAETYA